MTYRTDSKTIVREGFTGKNVDLDADEVERLRGKFPNLREGMLYRLAEVDRRMDRTPHVYGNRVRDNLLRYWNKDSGMKMRKAA